MARKIIIKNISTQTLILLANTINKEKSDSESEIPYNENRIILKNDSDVVVERIRINLKQLDSLKRKELLTYSNYANQSGFYYKWESYELYWDDYQLTWG